MNSVVPVELELYQICYSPQTFESIPEGMRALDNLSNPRPDWREYWPMRQFLLNTPLQEGILYGFFSPKFQNKTRLSAKDIHSFIQSRYNGESVVSFSPYWDMSSFFVNVIEQGEFFHHGLRDAALGYMNACGHDVGVIDQFMHSGNTIFCNYFVADRNFWMKWLEWGEMLFALTENQHLDKTLRNLLCGETSYGEQNVPRKIFLMERLASLLLTQEKNFTNLPYDMFMLPGGCVGLQSHLHEGICCDALKQKWDQSRSLGALAAFAEIRNRIFTSLNPAQIHLAQPERSHHASQ